MADSDALRGIVFASLVLAVLAGVPALMYHVCIRRLRRRFQAYPRPTAARMHRYRVLPAGSLRFQEASWNLVSCRDVHWTKMAYC